MAPNNALGRPTAAAMRARAEGTSIEGTDARETVGEGTGDVREAVGDAYGAGSAVGAAAVRARGTGTAARTPLEEFEARPRDEARCIWTAVMFLTRLPCPGWCDHHPGYLMRALCYFPLLGTVIGAWQACIYDAAASLWPPLVAAALSAAGTLWLTGCFHEDGLCDTLDGFGGGWTRSEILKIMRDSRSGSYATVGAGLWCLAKCATIAALGPSVWALGASTGAGPAIVVAQGVARASAAPLVYIYEYVVDDADAKGEFYNWFGDSRRLLGPWRVLGAIVSAATIALGLLPVEAAMRVLAATAVGTIAAGAYGQSVLGGVMGDLLGATICVLELAIYLTLAADASRFDASAFLRLAVVVSLPQIYGRLRDRGGEKAC